jgi:hypothetical protein
MATATAINGFPIPQTGDAPNVASDMAALGNAIDARVPAKFASATVRDSTITTPTEGMTCYVTGVGPQVYNGSAWVPILSGVAQYKDGSDSSSVTVPSGTWTFLTCSTAGATSGSNITIDSNGIIVPVGLFSVDAGIVWTTSGTVSSRRILGLSLGGVGVSPTNYFYQHTIGSLGNGQQVYQQATFGSVNATTSNRLGLWAYQDSGASLTVANRHTFVRQLQS